MDVIRLDKKTCSEWITLKHYSRKMSIYWAGFGLLDADGAMQGVCVYGQPSPPIQKHAFTGRDFRLYELTRLVIQTREKNAASFLIAGSLKMLDAPCAVISYADSEFNHCGIVYQATNWLYTGATKSHDHSYLVNGEAMKPITLRDRLGITNPKQWAKENNIKTIPPQEKYRYFYFCGTKLQKRAMLRKLKYSIVNQYPKCDQHRYDDGPIINHAVQENLLTSAR